MDTVCKPRKVLVLDDDEAIVDLLESILKQYNYQPITATHWIGALDALEHEKPELLLLDLAMPTVDGGSLLEFIRTQGNRIPVIIVSGHLSGEKATELARLGVDAFIWKPFKISDLMRDVERVIGPSSPNGPDALEPPQEAQVSEGPRFVQAEKHLPVDGPSPIQEAESESIPTLLVPDGIAPDLSRPPVPADIQISDDPEPSSDSAHTHHHRRSRRRRHGSRKASRRRTLSFLGIVTLACVLLGGFVALMQRHADGIDVQAKAQESIQKQILEELIREQALQKASKIQ